MANLGVLIETFNNIIGNQIEKKEILPATQAYKLLNFFFRNGNAGINALRELLEEMKEAGKRLPRFLLMENVPTLLSERHRPNFEMWMSDLNKLGYVNKYFPTIKSIDIHP